jgi:hypothetical protein
MQIHHLPSLTPPATKVDNADQKREPSRCRPQTTNNIADLVSVSLDNSFTRPLPAQPHTHLGCSWTNTDPASCMYLALRIIPAIPRLTFRSVSIVECTSWWSLPFCTRSVVPLTSCMYHTASLAFVAELTRGTQSLRHLQTASNEPLLPGEL